MIKTLRPSQQPTGAVNSLTITTDSRSSRLWRNPNPLTKTKLERVEGLKVSKLVEKKS
jgi:hypothetical protein